MPELPRQSGHLPIHIEDGIDWVMEAIYAISGTPVDVTNYTATFELRDQPGKTDDALLSLTEGSGIVVGTTDGLFTITITDAQTTFGDREMHYDLVVTSPTGVDTRILRGKCTSYAE